MAIQNRKIQKLVETYDGSFRRVRELRSQDVEGDRLLSVFAEEAAPVVVRDFLKGTHLDGVTFEDVRARAGHLQLDVSWKPAMVGHAHDGWAGGSEPIGVDQYLDQTVFATGPVRQDLYARYRNLRIPGELRRALALIRPSFLAPHQIHLPCIWMGAAGAISKLHTDPQDNFVLEVIGTRRFWLHAPSELERIHAQELFGSAFLRSPLDPRSPDHPAEVVTVDLLPGDLLMLPLGWAHFVECITASFSYNYWLDPRETPFFLRRKP